jgi:ATP-dependent exoDNAse (exonuclease V), alpha subunit - helicase superfamily I member
MRNRVAVKDVLPWNLEINAEFKAAFDLMENTRDCIFITGKAGTGKSTLLKYFKANTKKKIVILAPTGVAAVNVGGQTIHSFFKFPPKIIQKESIKKLHNHNMVEQLDVVIVDEVSMVRADLMDGIDYALRINRGQMKRPFGGAQMIFFGDLFQLCPIVDHDSKEILAQKYSTPYFFSAKAFNSADIKYVELSKVYRQKDGKFVSLLNRLRNKEHTEEDLTTLNARVRKYSLDTAKDATVVLTTTNSLAGAINQDRLARLPGKEFVYEANITGKFDEKACSTEVSLKLKKGAQIILLKNDPDKRWVNGTLGRVASLANDLIEVDIDGTICEVPLVKWQKIEYSYNEDEDKIEDETVGTFEQYPIKLAWAITIHKSQGQTFDKVILDLGHGAFTHGQVYVALSRCTRLDGIQLKRPVVHSDIIFDRRIYEFKDRFNSLL